VRIDLSFQYDQICRLSEESGSEANKRKRSLASKESDQPAEKRKRPKKKAADQPEPFIV
jgi:hypothetical protein